MNTENWKGDNPCDDCGTQDNIVWFTENMFWNEVMGEDRGTILCPKCFVIRAEDLFAPTGWRLLPDFPWFPKK